MPPPPTPGSLLSISQNEMTEENPDEKKTINIGGNKLITVGDWGTPQTPNDTFICVVHDIDKNKRPALLNLLQFKINDKKDNVDTVTKLTILPSKWWAIQGKHTDCLGQAKESYKEYLRCQDMHLSNGKRIGDHDIVTVSLNPI